MNRPADGCWKCLPRSRACSFIPAIFWMERSPGNRGMSTSTATACAWRRSIFQTRPTIRIFRRRFLGRVRPSIRRPCSSSLRNDVTFTVNVRAVSFVYEGNTIPSCGGIRARSRIIFRFGMAASLDQIVAATHRRVADAKRSADLRQLEQRTEQHVPRGFRQALATKRRTGPAIIAELKKSSPSRGLIRANFEPESLARELEAAGAAAMSVLTDEEFFQGSLDNLQRASASSKLPCLQKDFIVDEFQLLQARASCAD